MSILAITMLLAAAEMPATAAQPTVEGPVKMSMSQIRSYNAQLQPTDPGYIRCVLSEPAGSLVKRKVCRTMGEWERLAKLGQRDATELADYVNTHQFSMGGERNGSMAQTDAKTPY